ncbi:MAG: hypothetical protein ACI9CF_001196 [Candidatus Omnitrophota bacterium]|jgi:hypothetical protein
MSKKLIAFSTLIISLLIGLALLFAFHYKEQLSGGVEKHWIQASAKMGMVILDDKGLLATDISKLFLFQFGQDKRVHRLARGVIEGQLYYCFDFTSSKRKWGSATYPQSATVIAFPLKDVNLPFFWLKYGARRTWYRNISFNDYPAFSDNFIVSGPNEKSIKALFNSHLRRLFIDLTKSKSMRSLSLDNMRMDGGKEWLIVYSADKYLQSHELAPWIKRASHIKKQLLRSI